MKGKLNPSVCIDAVLENIITTNFKKIGHFHAAGNPDRHELTKIEIHYPSVFEAIQSAGFKGYFGLEYWPLMDPAIGLREVAQ